MSPTLASSVDMLEDVTRRARAMQLGLVAYPVDDVERVVAVMKAGNILAGMAETAAATSPPATSIEDRAILLLVDILDTPLATFAGGVEPGDKPMAVRLHTLRPDLSERVAALLEEAGA